MSRGFVKEDDQEEAPFIPPRAALPTGVPNYVTARGMKKLLEEKEDLEKERSHVKGENDAEKRRNLAVINGKMDLLNQRIHSARVLDPKNLGSEEVRFGTTVSYKVLNGKNAGTENTFAIVGVDEASVKESRIAFTAPIARALMGKRAGDQLTFKLGDKQQELEILKIEITE